MRDASGYAGCVRAPAACDTASIPQKPVNDTWEWRGPCCLVRIHQRPRKTLFTPTWQEPVWSGLKVYPVRTTVVQPEGSGHLQPYVEKVTTKKYFKSRKVAHVWTGETRFQAAPRVQGSTVVKIPVKLIVPAQLEILRL